MSKDWFKKKISLDEIVEKIPDGSHVYIGNTAATAQEVVNAMTDRRSSLVDIQIIQFLPGGHQPYLEKSVDTFRTSAFYTYKETVGKVRQGMADYTPISYSGLQRLVHENRIPVDVAIVKVSPPDDEGFCSLGIGVDISREMVEHAGIVIAEVTRFMPRTRGKSLVHVQDIDWWVENHQPLMTHRELYPEWHEYISKSKDCLDKIGKYILAEIRDGATIKIDLSPVANSVLPFLSERKHIGLHTDLFSDALMDLMQKGVIDNSLKNINHGKTIASHACGSSRLYEFIHDNPDVEFHPWASVNHVGIMGQHDNMVSVVGGLKVDLSGQVAVDSIGSLFLGGVGSVDDSIRGAAYSRGGKPIVALPSKSMKGNSSIRFSLPEGTGVTITRSDVHYVITEYGTAYLYGKSIRERCLALIDIAHPDFRDQLLREAKSNRYIHFQQPGFSFSSSYPEQWECQHTTKSGRTVYVRPIKAIDEDRLRDFFHKLSDRNVYMRYFTRLRSLPQKVLRHLSDIDYSKDMTLVALYPPERPFKEVVGIGQWVVDLDDKIPEIAFQIRDDWQGEGLGTYFFHRLAELSQAYAISEFKADVLLENAAMNGMFERAGIPFTRRKEIDVLTYLFDVRNYAGKPKDENKS